MCGNLSGGGGGGGGGKGGGGKGGVGEGRWRKRRSREREEEKEKRRSREKKEEEGEEEGGEKSFISALQLLFNLLEGEAVCPFLAHKSQVFGGYYFFVHLFYEFLLQPQERHVLLAVQQPVVEEVAGVLALHGDKEKRNCKFYARTLVLSSVLTPPKIIVNFIWKS